MLGTMFADHASRDWFMLGYAAAGAAAVTIAALAARGARDPRLLILLGALAGTALPFLLPKMLERYYFLGDVMTLALALSFKNRSAIFAVCTVQLASILSHIAYVYFFDHPYPALVGAAFAAAGLAAMCWLVAPSFHSLVAELGSASSASRGNRRVLQRPNLKPARGPMAARQTAVDHQRLAVDVARLS